MTGRGKPEPFRPNFVSAVPAGRPPPDRATSFTSHGRTWSAPPGSSWGERGQAARQAAAAGPRRCHWCGAPGQTGRCGYCKTWPEMDLAPPILTVPAGTDDALLADLLDTLSLPVVDPGSPASIVPLVLGEPYTFTPFPAAPSRPNPGDRHRQ